jgi:hypothetical protein
MRDILESDVVVLCVLLFLALISWGALGAECKDLLNIIIGGIIGWWGKTKATANGPG